MIRFPLVKMGILKEELDSGHNSITKSFASFTMVFVELLEILAILVPFVLTNYIMEMSLSLAVSVAISILLMLVVGRRLRSKFENKLSKVKIFAGMALILSGVVIIFNLM